jgi:hypothetical protein
VNRNNGVKDLPTSCKRPAAMLAVAHSDSGYRIRCLECEALGSYRENISSALAALRSRCCFARLAGRTDGRCSER